MGRRDMATLASLHGATRGGLRGREVRKQRLELLALGSGNECGTWGSFSSKASETGDSQAGVAKGTEGGTGGTGEAVIGQGWEDRAKSCQEAPLPISMLTTAFPPPAEADRGPDGCAGRAAGQTAVPAAQGAAEGAGGWVQPPLRHLLAGHEGPRSPVGSGRRAHTPWEGWRDPHAAHVLTWRAQCGQLGSRGPQR